MCKRCIADEVIDVLKARKGFDEWWESIDEYTQREILEEIAVEVAW